MKKTNVIRLSNFIKVRKKLSRKAVEAVRLIEIYKLAIKKGRVDRSEKFCHWIISCLQRRAYNGKNYIRWRLNNKTQGVYYKEIKRRIEGFGFKVEYQVFDPDRTKGESKNPEDYAYFPWIKNPNDPSDTPPEIKVSFDIKGLL